MKSKSYVIIAIFLAAAIATLVFPLENNSSVELILGPENEAVTFKIGQPLEESIQLLNLHGVDYICDSNNITIENGTYILSFNGRDELSRIVMHTFDGAGVILPTDYHNQETGYAMLEKFSRLYKALVIAVILFAGYCVYRKKHGA